jgi:glucose/mannose-6-phosphate isomerase
MKPIIPIKNSDVLDSIIQLKNTRNKISSQNITGTNPSLNLAKWINGIPIIYYPWGLQAAAIRFKNSLQENAKLHVITEDVVEACHT